MRLAPLAVGVLLAACRTANPVEKALEGHAEALREAREVTPGLSLECEPGDAEVLIDGVLQGSCADFQGRFFPLADGFHRIEVQKPGFRSWTAQVEAGRTRTVLRARLEPR